MWLFIGMPKRVLLGCQFIVPGFPDVLLRAVNVMGGTTSMEPGRINRLRGGLCVVSRIQERKERVDVYLRW
jgi:hypothetical protein